MAMTSANTGYLRFALAAGASLAALSMAAPGFAQSTAGDSAPQAEADADPNEIIVTAQFREQNLQDIPLAITAVTAAMIEAKSQTNLAQVADGAPNVSIRPQGASFGPRSSPASAVPGRTISTRHSSRAWASTSTTSITRN